MSKETKRVFRLFFVWQDEQEEQWLEQMAREGWRLVRAGVVYRFERDIPREVRYRLDYRSSAPGGWPEYLGLFRDAGWEHVGRFGGWQYFRTCSREAPEIFTDTASRAHKYRQLLALLLAAMTVNLITFVGNRHGYQGARALQAAVVLVLAYGMVRILLRLRRLRSQGT
jgi:hypothetical protein